MQTIPPLKVWKIHKMIIISIPFNQAPAYLIKTTMIVILIILTILLIIILTKMLVIMIKIQLIATNFRREMKILSLICKILILIVFPILNRISIRISK